MPVKCVNYTKGKNYCFSLVGSNQRSSFGIWLGVWYHIQWNPSSEATPFASEKCLFKTGGPSSGVEISTFLFRFSSSSGLSRESGLSSGWPLKRGSTVHNMETTIAGRFGCLFQSWYDHKETQK